MHAPIRDHQHRRGVRRRRVLVAAAVLGGTVLALSRFTLRPSSVRLPDGAQLTPVEDCENYLFPVRLRGKQGFIDRRGRLVIQPTFDQVYPFSDGLAGALEGTRWGYISKTGEWVIPPRYFTAGMFSHDRAAVRWAASDQIGYIDRQGRVVIEPQFDCAGDFVAGVAIVGNRTLWSRLTGGVADVGIVCQEYLIDVNGRVLDKYPQDLTAPGDERPGTAQPRATPRREGSLMGLADPEGNWIAPPRYDYIDEFTCGLALFTTDGGGKSGYIDESGAVVWEASE